MKNSPQLRTLRGWRYLSYGIALLTFAPILVIALSWLAPLQSDHWLHLREYVLSEALWNTLFLLTGVGVLTGALGTSTAWICSQYEFPLAKIMRRALVFPFAIPAYVNAFVYVGLLDFSGPLRRFLRESGVGDSFFPEVRSLQGGIILLALSLYPYVYVLAYAAFQSQGKQLREVARSLGLSPSGVFWKLGIPFARPFIIGGMCLAGLEVLNDFGTVSVVGVQTFTTAIYKVWFAFFSPETAAQLSSFLILLAFLVYGWDQYSRRRQSFATQSFTLKPQALKGLHAWLALGFCLSLLTLAFVVPLAQLLAWAYDYRADFLSETFRKVLFNSLIIGALAATVTCAAATTIVFARRYLGGTRLKLAYQISQLGYGIPGSVVAVGIFIPLTWVDRSLVAFLEQHFTYQGGLILTGTIFSMVLALVIRFLAVASSSIDSGSGRVSVKLDEASVLYGVHGFQQFRRIHWPLIKNSFFAGYLLVFVDVVKEMPLTLMTRPFGWDTLSVRIYSFISEGEWERASVPALGLVLIGILPLLFFIRGKIHE